MYQVLTDLWAALSARARRCSRTSSWDRLSLPSFHWSSVTELNVDNAVRTWVGQRQHNNATASRNLLVAVRANVRFSS